MGLLGNAFAQAARMHGIGIISEDERYEAQRKGATIASKIYEPIFDDLVSHNKMLEKIVSDEKKDYESKKKQIKIMYEKLNNEIDELEKRYREKNGMVLENGNIFSGSLIANDISKAIARELILGLGPIPKEILPDYKEAIQYGFNKTKDIFEKKIKLEQEKIDKVIANLLEFKKTSDESFEKAMKLITKLMQKKSYYENMLAR